MFFSQQIVFPEWIKFQFNIILTICLHGWKGLKGHNYKVVKALTYIELIICKMEQESCITRTICTRRTTTLIINIAKATCFTVCLPFSLWPHAGSDTWAVAQTLCACVDWRRVACSQGSCWTILGTADKTHLPEIYVYPYIMHCEKSYK